jgi:hypothetical protein
MGRPAHEPTQMSRRNVEALAGYGVPEADIAGVIGIDPKTLRKHYPQELRYGHVKANAKVAENLFRKATGDGRESVVAAIFWMKTRAKWKETTIHEVAEPTGNDASHSDAKRLGAVALLVARAQRQEGQHVLRGNLLSIGSTIAGRDQP